MTQYKMIQIPPNVAIAAKSMFGNAPPTTSVAAAYLEKVVNDMAAQGWEFLRVDPIGVTSSPCCIAGLFGAQAAVTTYYVITFKR